MRYKKKPKPNKPMTILFDDREKKPWLFLSDLYELKQQRLAVGDYTLEGYEDRIAVEKKSGMGELLSDLTSGYRKTFEKFLIKLSKYPIKVIVVESEFSHNRLLGQIEIMRKRSGGRGRLTSATIYHWTSKIATYYNIPMLFIDKQAVRYIVPTIFELCRQKADQL